MSRKELLRTRIEEERTKLDALAESGLCEAVYRQSKIIDGLMEEYINLAETPRF